MIKEKLKKRWARFWMRFSGTGAFGRAACGLAAVFSPPFFGRVPLAALGKQGYFSPKATIEHSDLEVGTRIFVGDGVLIYKDHRGGHVKLDAGVHLHNDLSIQTGEGGTVEIGENTHVQPRCQFSAYKGSIKIGCRVEIAPNCAFYPYDHEMESDVPITEQPIRSRGGIIIEDDVWLGFGVIVLDGVRIGKDAVVGAGSVVTSDIPAGAVAVGVPAHVVKNRYSRKEEV